MKKLFLLVPLIAMLLLGGFTFAPELNPQAYAELKAGDRVALYFQTSESKNEQRVFAICGERMGEIDPSSPSIDPSSPSMMCQQDFEYLLTEAVKELYPSVIPESMRFAIE